MESLETFGYLFYAVSPNRTSFETIDEVPEYTIQVVPYFALLVFLEQCVLMKKQKKTARVNDAIGSMFQGMTEEFLRILCHGWSFAAYIYVYNNWRLVTLPWDSLWTWWICFTAIDFIYYWAHRAGHEINFLWAAHQVHHSSEEYNLTTALRQSAIQHQLLSFFYLPMALAVPPSAYLVHNQLNLLYQFWIHTEVITKLGPLEYILNTASHHRVHHGRNRYCIDKNYGGTLIIWDRIFGTFQPEEEEVVYGLTHPINSFQPFYIQLCHYLHIGRTFWSIKGLKNKISVIFKGPGWSPGMPWHGRIEDIPDVHAPAEKYDPKIPLWCTLYVMWHFVLLLAGYTEIMELHSTLPRAVLFGAMAYQMFSFTSIGIFLEGRMYAPWIELLRCIAYFVLDYYFLPLTRLSLVAPYTRLFLVTAFRASFAVSAFLWLTYCIRSVTFKLHSKKIE